MTKLTTVGLGPLVAFAFLWPGAQPLRRRVMLGAIAAAVSAVIVAPWLLFNLHTYGQPLPSHATRALLGSVFGPPEVTVNYLRGSARQVFDEFIVGEPFAIMPLTRLLVWFAEGCLVLAAIGLWRSRRRLRLEWLLLLGGAADALWVVGTPFLSGVGGLMPGRYLYPDAAAAIVLVAAGIVALPVLITRVVAFVGGAGALLALGLLVSGPFGLVLQHQPVPKPSAGIAVHAQGEAAGLDVVADRVLLQDGGRKIWVHVTVTNRAPRAADFPATPAATTAADAWLWGDYSDGTAFLERLQPGESESGWLLYTRPNSSPLKQIHLTYTPISTDGYATIETLSLVVAP
jgi:hypothetical protein